MIGLLLASPQLHGRQMLAGRVEHKRLVVFIHKQNAKTQKVGGDSSDCRRMAMHRDSGPFVQREQLQNAGVRAPDKKTTGQPDADHRQFGVHLIVVVVWVVVSAVQIGIELVLQNAVHDRTTVGEEHRRITVVHQHAADDAAVLLLFDSLETLATVNGERLELIEISPVIHAGGQVRVADRDQRRFDVQLNSVTTISSGPLLLGQVDVDEGELEQRTQIGDLRLVRTANAGQSH